MQLIRVFVFAAVEVQAVATSSWTSLTSPIRFAQDGMTVSFGGRDLTVRRRC
jgi:hypothetical protein